MVAALIAFGALLGVTTAAFAGAGSRDATCFQTAAPYAPEIDVGSDVAIVYGVNESFSARVAEWRAQGYTAAMMTGIAWGGYDDYYVSGDSFKKEEVQTAKNGRLFMHGRSTTVGYNVPTPAYIEYIKHYIDPAIDAGVCAIYLEEPEYWAETGWSEAFKAAWQAHYGEPWQPPDSSVDAQYRASRLKYELYFEALRDVFGHVKGRAREKGIEIECHVPTHSLISYAHWRIVSPESHLIDLPEMDGYIAQVWTGTARTPNIYGGVKKERTFEGAFLEYGQMLGMVRPTGRKVWFLADPIEDNPDRTWEDYSTNYECTLVASLLWPEVHRFEVMPWPHRVFLGKRTLGSGPDAGKRVVIPADYAAQVLIAVNALNEMDQEQIDYDAGSRGIGVIVSDTMMFQRAAPSPSDGAMGAFYGLALPLLKEGVPVEVVQLENTIHPECLRPYDVLLLTYEHQKPLKPEYHEALAAWVRNGGGLVYIGDGSDPYHGVREWWNNQGQSDAKAYEDLFARLEVGEEARRHPQRVGKGCIRVVAENPSSLQHSAEGAARLRAVVSEVLEQRGATLRTQNYLCLHRGPFIVAAVLDESSSDAPLRLSGSFIDLFDPALPVLGERVVQPGQRALLYDIDSARALGLTAKVAAAAARIRNERLESGRFGFTARGPAGTIARARVLLPGRPETVQANPAVELRHEWDPASGTMAITFPNQAHDIQFTIGFAADTAGEDAL